MDISPYLTAIFKGGLKRGEAEETTNPILKEAMMFTSMVGVELVSEVADINDKVDKIILESGEWNC